MAGRAPVAPPRNKAAAAPEEHIRREEGDAMEAQIRRRAHSIYLERGSGDGFELDDWLQAENETRQPQSKEDA
jgi:hypothetical protein